MPDWFSVQLIASTVFDENGRDRVLFRSDERRCIRIRDTMSCFGSQAIPLRCYLRWQFSGDGCVTRHDALEPGISLVVNLNPFMTHLHDILFRLAFGVTPRKNRMGKICILPESRRPDATIKNNSVVTMMSSPLLVNWKDPVSKRSSCPLVYSLPAPSWQLGLTITFEGI